MAHRCILRHPVQTLPSDEDRLIDPLVEPRTVAKAGFPQEREQPRYGNGVVSRRHPVNSSTRVLVNDYIYRDLVVSRAHPTPDLQRQVPNTLAPSESSKIRS